VTVHCINLGQSIRYWYLILCFNDNGHTFLQFNREHKMCLLFLTEEYYHYNFIFTRLFLFVFELKNRFRVLKYACVLKNVNYHFKLQGESTHKIWKRKHFACNPALGNCLFMFCFSEVIKWFGRGNKNKMLLFLIY